MKQDWHPDELAQHWTLSAEERELLDSKMDERIRHPTAALFYKSHIQCRLARFPKNLNVVEHAS